MTYLTRLTLGLLLFGAVLSLVCQWAGREA